MASGNNGRLQKGEQGSSRRGSPGHQRPQASMRTRVAEARETFLTRVELPVGVNLRHYAGFGPDAGRHLRQNSAPSRGGRDFPDRGHSGSNNAGPEEPGDRISSNRLDEAELGDDPNRAVRASLADETIKIIEENKYITPYGQDFDISGANKRLVANTKFYAPSASKQVAVLPADWRVITPVELKERSSVAAARDWGTRDPSSGRVGVLNFASAKRRGGGFKNGAQAQEESLARASNLYLSLTQKEADAFYEGHQKDDKDGYYSHAMIYSKDVTVFRDDFDQLAPPVEVDMLTCAAVNAGVVRRRMAGRGFRRDDVESKIEETMLERMGRILQIFANQKVKVLILGSFGTGVFQNSISVVASCWAELLGHGGRFSQTFEHVEFAILGTGTFRSFQEAYAKSISRQHTDYSAITKM